MAGRAFVFAVASAPNGLMGVARAVRSATCQKAAAFPTGCSTMVSMPLASYSPIARTVMSKQSDIHCDRFPALFGHEVAAFSSYFCRSRVAQVAQRPSQYAARRPYLSCSLLLGIGHEQV
ncbi:hypothetical protein TRVL_08649 [Trypanosoma vivax]|nr:hypothetical protein TRVL_08649 [Trypanosoma vivax]